MTKNQQIKQIKQIESKIQDTQIIIKNYEQELNNHKSTLQTLTQQLQEIKSKAITNNKRNIK